MALKITTAADPMPVETICMTLYANPGLGKTSLAFTASKPLLLDFDGGAYRASKRGDTVRIHSWADVAQIKPEDVADYDTIILDTVGKALEFLTADILAGNAKLGWGGALNQQGWGQLGVRFRAYLSSLRRLGKDIVLVSHMDEKGDGDEIKERLKISGGSKDVVLTDSDVIARIVIANRKRALIFNPTEASFGKDPARMGERPLPEAESADYNDCLARIIAETKEALNALSEAQRERHGEVEWFRENLPQMETPEAINDVLGRSKKAGRDVAKMVVKRAEELGMVWDSDANGFNWLEKFEKTEEPEDEAETAEPDPAYQ